MIAVLVALAALPLGYLVRDRTVACLVFGLGFAHLYTFQTASLVMQWVRGSEAAFPAAATPEQAWEGSLGYLAVTTALYAVGFGLVLLGHSLRRRWLARAAGHQGRDRVVGPFPDTGVVPTPVGCPTNRTPSGA